MIKKIIAAIISFFLCLSLIGTVICLSAKSTWLNREYALDELGSQNYYNAVYDSILSSCESIGIPGGIPVEVFAEVLSRDTINQYIRNSIECLYTNKSFSVDEVTLKGSLYSAFIQYGKSQKADVYNADVKKSLNELADYCVSQYMELIQFPFTNELSPYISKAVKLIDTAVMGCIALSVICIVILILICRLSSAQYIGASLTGSGLICLIPCAVILTSAPYKNINLGIEVFYKFAVSFIESGLRPILTVSIIMLVTGVAMNITVGYVITSIFNRKHSSS